MKIVGNRDIAYIHALRIIACFLVIINHTHSYMLAPGYDASYLWYCMGFSLCKMAVTIFIMISAILMLDKEYSYKKVIFSIIKIMVPLIVLSFYFNIRNTGIMSFNLYEFIKAVGREPYSYPYWYMYMLIGLYMVIPFLQKMIKNFKEVDYIIFVGVFLFLPCIVGIVETYTNYRVNDYVFWSFFPKLLGIAIAGNFISKMELKKSIFIGSGILFIGAYIGMFMACYVPYCNTGKVSYYLDSYHSLPVVIMACTVVYMIRYLFEKRKITVGNFVREISKTTFGIYLLHPIFISELYKTDIMQNIFMEDRIIGTFVLEVSVFVVCACITLVLKRVPVAKQFV